MCGIVGIFSYTPIDRDALARAVAALHHRGPDSNGVFVDQTGRVGLGHTRLSIIDLSPTGDQPMVSEDGRVALTFNGEIYNYRELRSELLAKGHSFKGSSDTEVLLAGYLEYGTAILDRINGIFAFGIHDSRSGELFVARDHMGVKPVYYTQTQAGVAFASEIKALLKLIPIDRVLDPSAIRRYATFLWCPGELTPFKHVKKLAPGSAIIIRGGAIVRNWAYWRPPHYAPRSGWTKQDCIAELNELIGRCVQRQMVSDAPLGAFLSGGINSSAIVAVARKSKSNIECFTIELVGGAEQGTADDLPYARSVAKRLGVSLAEVQVDAKRMFKSVIDMVGILEEPLADPACLNVFFISELARSCGIKVLLSGVGGDDLFTGYRRHTMLAYDSLWSSVPAPVWRALSRVASGFDRRQGWPRRFARLMELAAANGNERIADNFKWGPVAGVDALLSPAVRAELAGEQAISPLQDLIAGEDSLSAVEKCLMLEQRFFLADHNLLYTDKMAMAKSVEVRVPFLDLEMIKFASEVPTNWKQGLFESKKILRESQRGILPDNIINRPKTGFGAPLRRWINGEMEEMVHDLLSRSTIESRGLFDADAVEAMLIANRQGQVDATYTLFSLMCIELWCQRFASGSEIAPMAVPMQ